MEIFLTFAAHSTQSQAIRSQQKVGREFQAPH